MGIERRLHIYLFLPTQDHLRQDFLCILYPIAHFFTRGAFGRQGFQETTSHDKPGFVDVRDAFTVPRQYQFRMIKQIKLDAIIHMREVYLDVVVGETEDDAMFALDILCQEIHILDASVLASTTGSVGLHVAFEVFNQRDFFG